MITPESVSRFLSGRIRVFLFYLVWVLFCTGLWLPVNWTRYGGHDWDLTYTTFEVSRKAIIEEHQFPAYNPYISFGSDLIANPQSVSTSIFILPVLALGSFYGYKLSLILGMMLGLYAMRKLLKSLGTENIVYSFLPLLFCSASYFSRHIMEAGHSNFLQFYLIPFVPALILDFKKKKNPLQVLLVILLLSEFLCGGAPLAFIMSVLIVMIILTHELLVLKEKQLILPAMTMIFMALGLSAWKILPVMGFWEHSPRLVRDDDFINLLVWFNALEDNPTNTYTPHAWHEFSIGAGIMSVLLIAFYREKIPHFKFWLLSFGFILWLSIGNFPPYLNPWYLVHHYLPIFDSMRAPSRFGFILLLGLSIGLGKVISKNDNKLIYIILTGIIISNTLNFNSVSRNLSFTPRLSETDDFRRGQPEILLKGFSYPFQFKAVEAGKVLPDAYEPLHLSVVSDTPSVFLSGADLLNFESGKIEMRAHKDSVRLALRYDSNWQVQGNNAGIYESGGLLNLKIRENSGNIVLKYHNPHLNRGILLSAIFLGLSFLLTFLLSANRKKTGNLSDR